MKDYDYILTIDNIAEHNSIIISGGFIHGPVIAIFPSSKASEEQKMYIAKNNIPVSVNNIDSCSCFWENKEEYANNFYVTKFNKASVKKIVKIVDNYYINLSDDLYE